MNRFKKKARGRKILTQHKEADLHSEVRLTQGWGTRGPRATCGPRDVFKRPASLLCNCAVKTARERTRTKRGLRPYYVTVAGDAALVLVYPSGFIPT